MGFNPTTFAKKYKENIRNPKELQFRMFKGCLNYVTC